MRSIIFGVLSIGMLSIFLFAGFTATNNIETVETVETVETGGKIKIDNCTFEGGTSRTGTTFVVVVSSSGKTYKRYLGTKTNKTFNLEGRNVPVFQKNHRNGSKTCYAVYCKSDKVATKKIDCK